MIYELVLGGGQRIYIKSDLDNIIASTIIPCRDHGSAGCLPKIAPDSTSENPQKHCQGTGFFSQMLCGSYEANHAVRQSTIVSHDMQTGEQQIVTNNVTSNDQSTLDEDDDQSTIYDQSTLYDDGVSCAGRPQDLRILRTCRQIYYEARSVLYDSNTFVFFSFATFAAYFGLVTPNQLYMPRSTEPNRLRAIQSMTKVELHSQVGGPPMLDFLSASRLIRMGLGCLTSLTSLELNLSFVNDIDILRMSQIDDCMFSKPSSLRKLVVDVQSFNLSMIRQWREFRFVGEVHKLEAAEGLVRRILKQEGYGDKIESFWRQPLV